MRGQAGCRLFSGSYSHVGRHNPIYSIGVLQIMFWVGGLERAITVGVLPFLTEDSIKMVTATYLALKIKRRLSATWSLRQRLRRRGKHGVA